MRRSEEGVPIRFSSCLKPSFATKMDSIRFSKRLIIIITKNKRHDTFESQNQHDSSMSVRTVGIGGTYCKSAEDAEDRYDSTPEYW